MVAGRKVIFALVAVALIAVVAGIVFRQLFLSDSEESLPHTLTLSGNIEAHESVLSFKTVQSRIVQLPFNEGQWVTKGTTVAAVDDTDYRQQVSIAEANQVIQQRQVDASRQNLAVAGKTIAADQAELAQRKLDYRRSVDLSRRGFVSAAALDQAQTTLKLATTALERDRALRTLVERNVDVAQAGVRNSEQALTLARIVHGYTILTAQFDGVITVRQAELGEMVVPGTPVLTLADLDHIWLRAYLNETDLGKVKLGEEITVKTDSYPNKQYKGRLSFISSKAEFTPKSVETHAERVTLVYRVKIDIDNPNHELVPGMPADALIALHQAGSA
ncbi:MAG TPA: HlyD family secretion protein [Oxalobacteraceae bacterium]|jgi:HlyD family secretion protein|nr:HlyD family secretion protein [Oxalobacteraceae bacterium]HCN89304.1 HlyD family secretion protein [Oxalobacteraceae bacterium]